jgi:hypothetical protein
VVVLDVNINASGIGRPGPTEGSPELPSYLKKDAGTPKNIGTINSLNLEAIAALKPDLILGSQLRAADSYDELSKIAPTVFSIRPGFTWKENYLLNAASLDKIAQAKTNLAAYDKRAEALGAELGTHKPTVSMVRYLPDGVIRLYGNDSFIGTILKDVGIPRPKNQDIADLAAEVSAENIDQADADWIFTGRRPPGRRPRPNGTRPTAPWKPPRRLRRPEGHGQEQGPGQPPVEEPQGGQGRPRLRRAGRDLVPGARRHGRGRGPRRPPEVPGGLTRESERGACRHPPPPAGPAGCWQARRCC